MGQNTEVSLTHFNDFGRSFDCTIPPPTFPLRIPPRPPIWLAGMNTYYNCLCKEPRASRLSLRAQRPRPSLHSSLFRAILLVCLVVFPMCYHKHKSTSTLPQAPNKTHMSTKMYHSRSCSIFYTYNPPQAL